eukprot:scaffold447125_cov37-Prasinocladus_malaysianus.AAC.2
MDVLDRIDFASFQVTHTDRYGHVSDVIGQEWVCGQDLGVSPVCDFCAEDFADGAHPEDQLLRSVELCGRRDSLYARDRLKWHLIFQKVSRLVRRKGEPAWEIVDNSDGA